MKTGISLVAPPPPLHPDSWFEEPCVVQASIAPHNLIQVGAFTGIYGGRLGHCKIGRYVSIAPGVDIASDQHPVDWLSTSMLQYVPNVHGWGHWLQAQGHEYRTPGATFSSNATVEIGHDSWIGQGVFIKSGVNIGIGAIVGARSVVTRNVPPYAVVLGSPARVYRMRFNESMIERLLASEWWRFNITSLAFDFRNPSTCLSQLEQAIEEGKLKPFDSARRTPDELRRHTHE